MIGKAARDLGSLSGVSRSLWERGVGVVKGGGVQEQEAAGERVGRSVCTHDDSQ